MKKPCDLIFNELLNDDVDFSLKDCKWNLAFKFSQYSQMLKSPEFLYNVYINNSIDSLPIRSKLILIFYIVDLDNLKLFYKNKEFQSFYKNTINNFIDGSLLATNVDNLSDIIFLTEQLLKYPKLNKSSKLDIDLILNKVINNIPVEKLLEYPDNEKLISNLFKKHEPLFKEFVNSLNDKLISSTSFIQYIYLDVWKIRPLLVIPNFINSTYGKQYLSNAYRICTNQINKNESDTDIAFRSYQTHFYNQLIRLLWNIDSLKTQLIDGHQLGSDRLHDEITDPNSIYPKVDAKLVYNIGNSSEFHRCESPVDFLRYFPCSGTIKDTSNLIFPDTLKHEGCDLYISKYNLLNSNKVSINTPKEVILYTFVIQCIPFVNSCSLEIKKQTLKEFCKLVQKDPLFKGIDALEQLFNNSISKEMLLILISKFEAFLVRFTNLRKYDSTDRTYLAPMLKDVLQYLRESENILDIHIINLIEFLLCEKPLNYRNHLSHGLSIDPIGIEYTFWFLIKIIVDNKDKLKQ